ncbi:Anucleate primary sterigmata protein B [Boothiomyces sp. JEL0866]|nr:Anucleate primary sterigmata protein B [Boothiomyces sp. JEL0866]
MEISLESEPSNLNILPDENQEENFSMGLRQREDMITKLEKENFSLKMKVCFLQENLSKITKDGMIDIINEHAELKAMSLSPKGEVEDLQEKIKEMNNLLIEKDEDISHLVKELEISHETICSMAEQREQDEELLYENDSKIRMLLNENQELLDNLNVANDTKAMMEHKSEEYEQEIEQYKAQIDRFKKLTDMANAKLTLLQKELSIQSEKLMLLEKNADETKNIQEMKSQGSQIYPIYNTKEIQSVTSTNEIATQVEAQKPDKSFQETRERYINELKERNYLLVRVSQHLDDKLGYKFDPKSLSSFTSVKKAIMKKLKLLDSVHDQFSSLSKEKIVWESKFSRMESKIVVLCKTIEELQSSKKNSKELEAQVSKLKEILHKERAGANQRVNELLEEKKKLEHQIMDVFKHAQGKKDEQFNTLLHEFEKQKVILDNRERMISSAVHHLSKMKKSPNNLDHLQNALGSLLIH